MYAKKSVSMKVVVLLLAVVLLLGCAVGGTLAWLMDKTDPVQNTFTAANINITLTETPNADSADEDTENDIWEGKMVPGTSIAKDPVVTVKGGSEACWLFVKVLEEGGSGSVNDDSYTFADYVTYTVKTTGENAWNKLDDVDGVYYMEVDASNTDQPFYVLAGDEENANGVVSIPNTVTKAMLDAIGTGEGKIAAPSLTFTAYAVQKEGSDTAAEAWTKAQSLV